MDIAHHAAPQAVGDGRYLVWRALLMGLWVVVILAIFSRFALAPRTDARRVTIEHMRGVQTALDRYAVDNCGALPTGDQGLMALVRKPQKAPIPRNWRGPYVRSPELIADGWGRRLQYAVPGGRDDSVKDAEPVGRPYDLWSLGPSGAEGGSGADAGIRSWDAQTLVP